MMKKIWLSIFALSLTACGFTPVHAPQTAGSTSVFNNISVEVLEAEDIADSEGAFYLEQQLYDRLGTQGGDYLLTIEPSFSRGPLGVSANDVASRYVLYGKATYALTDKKTGEGLDLNIVTANVTYGAPRDPYGLTASTQDATERVAKELSDRVLTRLSAYFANPDRNKPEITDSDNTALDDSLIQLP